jgi:hypothetical protein
VGIDGKGVIYDARAEADDELAARGRQAVTNRPALEELNFRDKPEQSRNGIPSIVSACPPSDSAVARPEDHLSRLVEGAAR